MTPPLVFSTLRTAVLACACALGAAVALAQPAPCALPAPPSRADVQAAAKRPVDRGFLWRIEKNGRASWLYGTMHVGKPDWYFQGPRLLGALGDSDTLALELDMADPASLKAFTDASDAGVLARMLTPERQRRLDRQVAAACLPEGSLARLRPTLQVMALAGLAARNDGLYEQYGSERYLALRAHTGQQPVVALETARDQLQALLGDDEAEEITELDEALDQLESGSARDLTLRLANAWARSDWAELASYRAWCDCVKTPADARALRRLLDDRNPGLADGIAALHARGRRVFAAVGALHMAGAEGLPALMAARGFVVTPVFPAP